MNICRYCQDNIPDGQDFLVVAPNQTKYSVCAECQEDLERFFSSGKAEKKNMQSYAPKFFLDVYGSPSVLLESDGEKVGQLSGIYDAKCTKVNISQLDDPWSHKYLGGYRNPYDKYGGMFDRLNRPAYRVELVTFPFDSNPNA